MSLIIYSDPHIGVNLMANTTPASRERLSKAQWRSLDKVEKYSDGGDLVCGGDFFHSHRVDEDAFLAGLKWAQGHSLILSGNHDIVNDRYKSGSMDILKYVCRPDKFAGTRFGEVNTYTMPFSKGRIYGIPHCTTQELFEQSIDLQSKAAAADGDKWQCKILLLHCNYDNPLATKETELNLTRTLAKQLLENHFDYVILGHEHNFRTDLNDRLIVIGNTYPTNFGDIEDKYCLAFDEKGEPELCTLWEKGKGYIEVDWADLSPIKPHHEWVRITGNCPPGSLHDLTKAIKKLWLELPEVVAIKLDVKLEAMTNDTDYKASEVNLMKLIQSELANQPEMLKLWKELTDDN